MNTIKRYNTIKPAALPTCSPLHPYRFPNPGPGEGGGGGGGVWFEEAWGEAAHKVNGPRTNFQTYTGSSK